MLVGRHDINANVMHPSELGSEEQRLWDAYARDANLGSPFLSWAFTELIGRVRPDARVAVMHDGSEVCGFLPFQVGEDGSGTPIGATICDAQAFIGRADWSFDAAQLVAAAGLARWRFDHLTTAQTAFAPYYRSRHQSPVIRLRAGYEAFIQELRSHSKDFLSQIGRRRRKLEREVGPVVCDWQSAQPDQDMVKLQQWKSDQYERTGSWDRFAEGWITETVGALAQTRDANCSGVLTVLRAGDRLVAAHFGLLGRDRLSWWFPAYDPEFGRYSPGLILLLDLIAEAARQEVPLIDLGRGEHDYKLRLTPHFYEVAEGEVVTTRA
jgi:CelD/BcsL family acetyltransferase involved in cellulose biosynthesis